MSATSGGKQRIAGVDNFATAPIPGEYDANWWLKDRICCVLNTYNKIAGLNMNAEYWKLPTAVKYIKQKVKKQGLELNADNIIATCEKIIKRFKKIYAQAELNRHILRWKCDEQYKKVGDE